MMVEALSNQAGVLASETRWLWLGTAGRIASQFGLLSNEDYITITASSSSGSRDHPGNARVHS